VETGFMEVIRGDND